MGDYKFFWKSHYLSQWAKTPFIYNGFTFTCAEQFMMYKKALLFNDSHTALLILDTEEPYKMKQLGRKVKNFDEKIWNDNKEKIVEEATILKFSQNEDIKKKLIATAPKELVEASPYDTVWGIGLTAGDPRAKSKETWLGQNLLGKILTKVRDNFIKDGV